MDMAGFALNVRLILDNPTAQFRLSAGRGNLESDLLLQLGLEMKHLEPKADNCRQASIFCQSLMNTCASEFSYDFKTHLSTVYYKISKLT